MYLATSCRATEPPNGGVHLMNILEHLVIGGETPHGRCDAQVARSAPPATRMGPLIDPGSVPMSDRDSGSATPGASPGATTGATLGATLGAALSSGPVLLFWQDR